MSTKFDEAAAKAFATFNALMDARFEAILENAQLDTMAFQQALASLHQENQEFQQQFTVNMQAFQTNMLRMFLVIQQDMMNCIMNNQATLQQAVMNRVT
jgi:hypothetical protein